MIIDRKTLSILQACKAVGVSRRTIYNWLSTGKVEYVRTAGGAVRIFADTLWREPGAAARAIPPQADANASTASRQA
jgi:excisionase family DNA binding protein